MPDTTEKGGSSDRRGKDRRSGERRQEDAPTENPDRRTDPQRRIGSRRTGTELKFCSSCGKKITGVPTIPINTDRAVTMRLCPDCARTSGGYHASTKED